MNEMVTMRETVKITPFPFQKMIPKNMITVLWGVAQSGKTAITSWYELEAIKAGHKVLHIELDESKDGMKQRLGLMAASVGCPQEVKKNLILRFDVTMKLDTDTGLETLRELMEEHRPRVLVLSPIGNLVEGDINMHQPVTKFFDNLKAIRREFNCTIVLHGHLNKKGQPTGNTHWMSLVEMAWLMEKVPDVVKDAPHRMFVTQMKARVDAPMGFEWSLTGPEWKPNFVSEKTDKLTVSERIMISSVLGFVLDQHKQNYAAYMKHAKEDDRDDEGRKRKKTDPWVTIQEYMAKHEGTMGGKTKAYEMFMLAAEMGLITRLEMGEKGVQKFVSNDKLVAWLRMNRIGVKTNGTPRPASLVSSPVVAAVMEDEPLESEMTEEERADQAWIARHGNDLDSWNLQRDEDE